MLMRGIDRQARNDNLSTSDTDLVGCDSRAMKATFTAIENSQRCKDVFVNFHPIGRCDPSSQKYLGVH